MVFRSCAATFVNRLGHPIVPIGLSLQPLGRISADGRPDHLQLSVSVAIRFARAWSNNALLDSIPQTFDAFGFGAMLATKESTCLLQTMSDDPDSAMTTGWCEHVDGAFETIEGMRISVHRDLKSLVVLISAGFTGCHGLVAFSDISVFQQLEKY